MRTPFANSLLLAGATLALSLATGSLQAQAAVVSDASAGPAQQSTPETPQQAKADAHKLPAERGNVVDRIVAIVNGDIVLESEVEAEERFTQLNPYRTAGGSTPRQEALNRIINRDLILQQMAGYPQPVVTEQEIDKQENELRKDLPACQHTDCKSDTGWKNFLAKLGFTEQELRDRLRTREQVLQFIEQRFRSGIVISDEQIEDFYNKTMLPEYARQHATAPPIDAVHDRIEDLLLEQQVSKLLDQWLKSLRESGSVRILQPNEEAP